MEMAKVGMMSWKPEVRVPADNKWYDNAIRFETEAEAYAYARELESRWTQVREIRTSEVDDPVNADWVDGKTVWRSEGAE